MYNFLMLNFGTNNTPYVAIAIAWPTTDLLTEYAHSHVYMLVVIILNCPWQYQAT